MFAQVFELRENIACVNFHYFHTVKLILFFLGFVLLTSCSDLKRPDQKNKLELIRTDLSLLLENDSEYSLDSILIVVNQIEVVEKRIKSNFQYDTLNIEMIKNLDRYKRIHPALSFVIDARQKIDSSLSIRNERIESLSSDIENSVGNRAKYDEFISFERDNVDELLIFINYCDSSSKESFKTFHNLHPIIESFSFKLEKENQEQ